MTSTVTSDQAATGYAWSRVAVGTALLLKPGALEPVVGRLGADADGRGMIRMLAVRDLVLGVAGLLTANDAAQRRRVLGLCAAADAVDFLVSVSTFRRTRRGAAALTALGGLGGAVTGAVLAGGLPDR